MYSHRQLWKETVVEINGGNQRVTKKIVLTK
jgi:hypothetical protein